MGVKQTMTGCVWHTEKMVRQDGDEKRHKSRCKFYRKSDSYCSKVVGKCTGSAHCPYYIEEKMIEQSILKTKYDSVVPFEGIKEISIDMIEVGNDYKKPIKEKIDTIINYYNEHGEIDKPIYVSCNGSKYKLEDKYLRYFVAVKLGLKTIPAKIYSVKSNKIEDKIRTKGSKITHKKYGKGIIVDVSPRYITVKFENAKEIQLDVDICINKQLIKIGW